LVDRWGKMVDAFKTGKGFFNSIGRFFKSFVTDVDDSANAIKRADRAMGGVRKVQVTTEEMEGKKRGLFQNTLGAENSGLKAKSALGNIGNQQNTTNTNNARVDITVNDPGGNANVRGLADDLDLFSLNTGLSGAAQ